MPENSVRAPVAMSTVKRITVQSSEFIEGVSSPNYACAATEPGFCSSTPLPIYVDFTKPVSGLKFRAIAVESSDAFGAVKVIHEGRTDTVTLTHTSSDAYQDIDLSSFVGVSRIEITNDESYGIGIDDVVFDAPL